MIGNNSAKDEVVRSRTKDVIVDSSTKDEVVDRSIKDVIVIIPAFNEEKSIGYVITDIPREKVIEVIVVNNGSDDRTAEVARNAGATVLTETRKGYGSACLKGIEYARTLHPEPTIAVFLDADYSDSPGEMPEILKPIREGIADMVIGARVPGKREPGSMMPQQIFGNWLATRLMRLIYGVHYTDLGPFRAIRFATLNRLGMIDTNFGWTVEMQIKAARMNVPFREVPVSYKNRIGVSKIAGTVSGTVKAGYKIIYTILKYSRK
ncbi:MAG: glycosyltransferase family 2 protein [Rhodothermaceae bacterium]|nr:glycosyltransferase family 2 protein [Rhodothermaceae bacterium]